MTGNQIGIVGSTVHGSGQPTTFADSQDLQLNLQQKQQIQLSSASMAAGFGNEIKEHEGLAQNELQM